jgi:hypothetical protein
VSFATIFDQEIIAKEIFNSLRQVEKWGFSYSGKSWNIWGANWLNKQF